MNLLGEIKGRDLFDYKLVDGLKDCLWGAAELCLEFPIGENCA